MDLEVAGRHTLLFDDDSMAAFLNSPDALIEWNSLSIDRFDVRHLLSAPPPPRRRRKQSSPLSHADSSLEVELDHERYLDLPPDEEDPGVETGTESLNGGGFHAVAFSYGNTDESYEQKTVDSDSAFRPPFQVPEDLLQNLPPTEKVHQIMARTALFVSKHGGQSEIVLRVKQRNNPMFGFLTPEQHLHPYFRFLVDHQELLASDTDGKSSEAEKRGDSVVGHTGGALSLLGSVYGTGEDEDGAPEASQESQKSKFGEKISGHNVPISLASKGGESIAEKEEPVPKHTSPSLKEKASPVKKKCAISTVKVGTEDGMKKDNEAASLGASGEKKKSSAFSGPSRDEPILDPPSELKRVVEKIVEFILRNGRQFETILIEQDRNHGRFLFLLPTNQYHPYYLKVLESEKEPKSAGMKNDGVEKKYRQSKVSGESHSVGSDIIPDDLNKKEKFKMVIGKNKKDSGQDQPPEEPLPEMGVGIDAAAAILEAVRRGIKHPNLPKAAAASLLSGSRKQQGVSLVPAAKAIAETAAMTAAGEADSSEASLTREQKLKAERLRRAKMFTSMLKIGAASLSKTPTESVVTGSGAEVATPSREREGSSVPPDIDASGKDEQNARRSKRSYRSRIQKHDDDDDDEAKEEEEEDGDERKEERSRKKRRSHTHRSERHKKRKRHSSSKDAESRRHRHRRHKHDSSSNDVDDDDNVDDLHHRKHRYDSYEDDEDGGELRRDGKRSWRHSRRSRSQSRSHMEKEDLEEGEISGKSGESRASGGGDTVVRQVSQPSEEASTEVPDDFRAKIRAMLMATM